MFFCDRHGGRYGSVAQTWGRDGVADHGSIDQPVSQPEILSHMRRTHLILSCVIGVTKEMVIHTT